MVAEKPLLALSETTSLSEQHVVTTENFTEYLDSKSPLPATYSDLAPVLNLDIFTPGFQSLVTYTKKGFKFDEGYRTVLSHMLDEIDGESESVIGTVRNRTEAVLSEQAVLERGNTGYIHQQTGAFEESPIADGLYTSVVTDVFSLLRDGHDPRISKHTHPDPSLPSPADLRLHLQEDRDNNQPPVRASVTLCPGMQILTLVTRETMGVMSQSEMGEFIEYWNQRASDEGKDERREIRELSQQIIESYVTHQEEEKKRGLEKLNRLKEIHLQRPLSSDEWDMFNDEFARLNTMNHVICDPRMVPEYVSAQKTYFDNLNSATNRVLIEMLREVNVAVYMSSDMQHFEKVMI